MNHSSLSLEQELALIILSIQIQKNTDVAKLQDDLIELFEKILIKQQNLQDVYDFPREEESELTSYLRANLTLVSEVGVEAIILPYIDSIRKNHDVEELQALLIDANEICMMQKNHIYFISQYMSDHQSMI